MFVVAIYGWREETPEMVQALADALGIIVFEVRQRLIGGGPSVVAGFADQQQASVLAEKLDRIGIKALIVDAAAVRLRSGFFIVRRFKFEDSVLKIEAHNGQQETLPYARDGTDYHGYKRSGRKRDKNDCGEEVQHGQDLAFRRHSHDYEG